MLSGLGFATYALDQMFEGKLIVLNVEAVWEYFSRICHVLWKLVSRKREGAKGKCEVLLSTCEKIGTFCSFSFFFLCALLRREVPMLDDDSTQLSRRYLQKWWNRSLVACLETTLSLSDVLRNELLRYVLSVSSAGAEILGERFPSSRGKGGILGTWHSRCSEFLLLSSLLHLHFFTSEFLEITKHCETPIKENV